MLRNETASPTSPHEAPEREDLAPGRPAGAFFRGGLIDDTPPRADRTRGPGRTRPVPDPAPTAAPGARTPRPCRAPPARRSRKALPDSIRPAGDRPEARGGPRNTAGRPEAPRQFLKAPNGLELTPPRHRRREPETGNFKRENLQKCKRNAKGGLKRDSENLL